MMDFLASMPVEQLVVQYGYWAVFCVIGLESAGLPLPGEITLMTAAAIAGTTGLLQIEWVLAAAAAGAVLGDNVGYWLGREFGLPLLLRYGPKVRIGERQIKLGQYLFLRHGGKVVFFGRMVALLRVLAALLAGINRMPWWRFFFCNVGGGILWACLYGGGAYLFGRKVQEAAGSFGCLAAAAALIGLLLTGRYIKAHQRTLEDAAERCLPGPLVHPHLGPKSEQV